MLVYKAMNKTIDECVHAEVLDFPGAISFGADLEEAHRMLASAIVRDEYHVWLFVAVSGPNLHRSRGEL